MTGDCSLRKKIEEEKQCSGILGFGMLSLRQLCSMQKEIFHRAENMSSTFRRLNVCQRWRFGEWSIKLAAKAMIVKEAPKGEYGD